MKEVLKFLTDSKVFYLATAEGSQPRVRPFGFAMEFEGKLFFVTGASKPTHAQIKANPAVEICACAPNMDWLRISGKAVFSDSLPAREKAMEILPMFKQMYPGGAADPNFAMFYLENAEASFCSMQGAPRTVKL